LHFEEIEKNPQHFSLVAGCILVDMIIKMIISGVDYFLERNLIKKDLQLSIIIICGMINF
jgi:FixJ family two-component response regulator